MEQRSTHFQGDRRDDTELLHGPQRARDARRSESDGLGEVDAARLRAWRIAERAQEPVFRKADTPYRTEAVVQAALKAIPGSRESQRQRLFGRDGRGHGRIVTDT